VFIELVSGSIEGVGMHEREANELKHHSNI